MLRLPSAQSSAGLSADIRPGVRPPPPGGGAAGAGAGRTLADQMWTTPNTTASTSEIRLSNHSRGMQNDRCSLSEMPPAMPIAR